MERPGELLSKKELLKALWPGVVVEENSLNQVISLIRKVLGEKPSEHRFIVTAPGRGYRFVAAVRLRGGAPESEPEALSLAVLPFADQTGTLGKDYLGEAIAADLIRLLSARSRISVASHTSSFVFKSPPADARVVAKTLNVSKVLIGQIAGDGDQLTITAHLMDGKTGQRIKTTSQRRHASDLMELQADLAREIALALDPGPSTSVSTSANVDPGSVHALSACAADVHGAGPGTRHHFDRASARSARSRADVRASQVTACDSVHVVRDVRLSPSRMRSTSRGTKWPGRSRSTIRTARRTSPPP